MVRHSEADSYISSNVYLGSANKADALQFKSSTVTVI